jgi:hypothetical protein
MIWLAVVAVILFAEACLIIPDKLFGRWKK